MLDSIDRARDYLQTEEDRGASEEARQNARRHVLGVTTLRDRAHDAAVVRGNDRVGALLQIGLDRVDESVKGTANSIYINSRKARRWISLSSS